MGGLGSALGFRLLNGLFQGVQTLLHLPPKFVGLLHRDLLEPDGIPRPALADNGRSAVMTVAILV